MVVVDSWRPSASRLNKGRWCPTRTFSVFTSAREELQCLLGAV